MSFPEVQEYTDTLILHNKSKLNFLSRINPILCLESLFFKDTTPV